MVSLGTPSPAGRDTHLQARKRYSGSRLSRGHNAADKELLWSVGNFGVRCGMALLTPPSGAAFLRARVWVVAQQSWYPPSLRRV